MNKNKVFRQCVFFHAQKAVLWMVLDTHTFRMERVFHPYVELLYDVQDKVCFLHNNHKAHNKMVSSDLPLLSYVFLDELPTPQENLF